MRRYWLIVGAIAAFMMAMYVIAESTGIAAGDPSSWLGGGGPLAALISIALLSIDVVLPIPSSLVMVANGAVFGFVIGALLSAAGGLSAFSIAFAIGRRGGRLLDRLIGPKEARRADEFLRSRGPVAITATRPVPILAETTALMAGASSIPWGTALWAALLGILPQAIIYGISGALLVSFSTSAAVFSLTLLATAVAWFIFSRQPISTD